MSSNTKGRSKFPLRINIAIPLLAVTVAAYLQVSEAQTSTQRTFASAEEASRALFVAAESQDSSALAPILGKNGELTSSSDATQERLEREQFVRKYREMHRLVWGPDGAVVLYIGAENWPFPIPLVSHDGVWRYDSDAGETEVLNRRIGENEVTAIEVCDSLIATQKEPQATADTDNPVFQLLDTARTDNKPVSFHGYSFRLLSKPGTPAFGIVAYPTVYGSSGVMTFVVNNTGIIYQKDLGPRSQKVAMKMAAYHADSTWTPAEDVKTTAP